MTDEVTPYTIANLKQVEDQAVKFGLSPNLESRFARRALALKQSGVTYFRLAPGYRMPFGHTHEEQEEIYLIVTGSVRMKLDDEIVELGAWDAIRVSPEVARSSEAGPSGAEIVAYGAPQAKDAAMLQDFWTD